MSKKTILGKAIDKALKNGWQWNLTDDFDWETDPNLRGVWLYDKQDKTEIRESYGSVALNEIIFNHDFAKAFFGEKDAWVYSPFGDEVKERVEDLHNTYPAFVGPSWQFHLQRMVLEPEPLKYLEQFL